MRKLVFVVSIIIFIVLINNLARSIYDLWKKQDLITSAQKGLEAEKAENARLKRELTIASKPDFIEKEARDKLGLAKEGEIVLVLPDNETLKKLAPVIPDEEEVTLKPNWKKWIDLFK